MIEQKRGTTKVSAEVFVYALPLEIVRRQPCIRKHAQAGISKAELHAALISRRHPIGLRLGYM
jgi:hypothetical protein